MHYFIQDVYQPLAAVAIFDKVSYYGENACIPVYLMDDGDELSGINWTANARVYNAAFEVVASEAYNGVGSINSADSQNVAKLFDIGLTSDITASAPLFVVTEVKQGDTLLSRNYYFVNYNDSHGSLFTLPVTTVEFVKTADGFTVTNTGEYPAVAVSFDCSDVSDTFLPEDSYFWLEAGETKHIAANSTEGVDGITFWNMKQAADTALPTAPSGLAAEAVTQSQTKLTWNAVESARGYFVYCDGELIAYVKTNEYTVCGLAESESHSYYVTAYTNGGAESAASAEVIGTSAADTTAPTVVSMKMATTEYVEIEFSEQIDAQSAGNTANYAVADNNGNYEKSNGVIVTAATLEADGKTVLLTLSGADGKTDYKLTVSGIADISVSGNVMAPYTNSISNKLEIYWDFNAGEGEYLYDVTGNAGLGTLLTDKVKWTNDGVGGAVNFDGVVSSISVRKSQISLADGFSISAMVKTDVVSDTLQTVLARNIYPISGYMSLAIYDGKVMFYSTDLYPRVNFVSSKSVADGSWHQIGVTYDGNAVKIYVDGEISNTYPSVSGTVRRDNCEWAIGRLVRNINRFNGSLDEIRVYSRAITADEMQVLAQAE